ncbi:MAG: hypothetical protein RR420_01160, partial [Anaerovoracaceae bacterium]
PQQEVPQQEVPQQEVPQQEVPQQREQIQDNGLGEEVSRLAASIAGLPSQKERDIVMSKIPESSRPKVAEAVQKIMQQKEGSKPVDMRPMPEQRPPRRDSLK